MNWRFAAEVTGIAALFGALLGLMLSAALPHRADERTPIDASEGGES